MDKILYYICIPLGYLMKWCWMLISNYGLAIILFTLATKLVLLPISIWIQKNSIAMVKIQPAINFLKVKHYGDVDTITEEQAKLFKKEKYHPMLSLVPLALQLILLMGVVQIIYHPLGYLFSVDSDTVNALANFIGADTSASSFQLDIVNAFKDGTITANTVIDGVSRETLSNLSDSLERFNLSFLGLNISKIPSKVFRAYLLMPVIAGLSSWVLCFTQNLSNVIQHEQGKISKYGLMVVSVGISLYLGFFVPCGIAIYWVASNLMSVAQMYILNACINPKKYVDYEALEKSRKELAAIEALDKTDKKSEEYKLNKKREKADYKHFFKIVNKHVVIYSEKSGFYKYFEAIIKELLSRSNLTIHYVTNDPNDIIFEIAKTEPRIQPYYIGIKKTITLMMKIECDIVVMTTPDLNKFYIKRSFMKKDIEYIYIPHDMMSISSFREGAFDAFDTIFCTGKHIETEIRKTEEVYKLKQKKLVKFGYPLSDLLVKAGEEEKKNHKSTGKKEILIAPSWNEDNLLDSCIDTLIEKLYCDDYRIIIRPHPEYVKRFASKMKALTEKYENMVGDNLVFELDFLSSKSIYSSDLIITDWSGIGPEFAFATKRPALFVNTKYKCLNPNYTKLDITPVEISLRDILGVSCNKEDLDKVDNIVKELFANQKKYEKQIEEEFDSFVYNHGCAAEHGAKYILSSLVEKRRSKS